MTTKPWVGPRPYEENEWNIFFGRLTEVNDVENRISNQHLTILAGRSGTGKTSLLRAGVIARLRLRRYRSRSGDGWPTLALREWGAGQASRLDDLLKKELLEGVKGIEHWVSSGARARADLEMFGRAIAQCTTEDSFLDCVDKVTQILESPNEGLILIFDQLEEVLRLGSGVSQEMVEVIRTLYQSPLRLRILLSLREEYLPELRHLERTVGGLMGRSVFLKPMTQRVAEEAILESAAAAKVSVSKEIASRIFSDLLPGLGVEHDPPRELQSQEGNEQDSVDLNEEEVTNLLALQAVLIELFEFTQRSKNASSPLTITKADIEKYLQAHKVESRPIYEGALSRWISRAFDEQEFSEGDPELDDASLLGLIRRIATRIAPHLSSAGYKVALEQSDLFRKAVGDDVWALGLKDPQKRAKIRIDIDSDSPSLNLEELGLSEDGVNSTEHLSGFALAKKWNRAQTAQALLRAFLRALDRMHKANVVKPVFIWSEAVKRWELIHDGLGDPLSDWAEKQRNGWADCASSIVACKGVSPIGIRQERPPQDSLYYVKWLGCHVAPISGGKVVLKDIVFDNCDLTGTIFQNIIFDSCTFKKCNLSGTVFQDCTLISKPTEASFVNCPAPSIALLDSTLQGLLFEDCKRLTQLTVHGCSMVGTVEVRHSVLELANFTDLKREENDGALQIDSQSIMLYCSGDRKSWVDLLSIGCETVRSGWEKEVSDD